jgi:RimJ/RimL family protein N-acetyltransferase
MKAFDRYRIERLASPHLHLEPLREAHAEMLFTSLQDPDLYTYVPEDAPLDVSRLQDRFRSLETRRSPDGEQLWLNWVIWSGDEPAGLVQATCTLERKLFVAYEVFSSFRRRGIAVAAVRLMLSHLRRHQLADLALAYVDTRNEASISVLERLGFSRVRMLTGADYFKGSVSDEYEYVRTMSEG